MKKRCQICHTSEGKLFARRTGHVHADCARLLAGGYLNTGGTYQPKDSTGRTCEGCSQPIDTAHAHRQGKPYHRECLT